MATPLNLPVSSEYQIHFTNAKLVPCQARWQAAWVLGRIKSEEAVEPLIEALGDPDWMVRDEAAVALVRINSGKAVELLVEALKHKSDYVRREAVWVLAGIKSDGTGRVSESQDISPRRPAADRVSYNQKVSRILS